MENDDNQKKVIEADLNEKIFVDAPPGSGKTYCIVEKINYLCRNKTKEQIKEILDNILILCYSRAAVKEIKSRIKISDELKNVLMIKTIDSFSYWIIKECDTEMPLETFHKYTYDQLIEYSLNLLKNDEVLRETIKGIKHIILDECQDVVGIRAQFAIELLEKCEGGFTILGDRCQAIFDYQAKGMPSEKFINEILKKHKSVQNITLEGQYRQEGQMVHIANDLRKKIKEKDEKVLNQTINDVLENLDEIELEKIELNNSIILCRKNGQIYDLIKKLKRKYKILDNTNKNTLPDWIGIVLYDYSKKFMTKNQFFEIIRERIGQLNEDKLDQMWRTLKTVDEDKGQDLNILRLKSNINYRKHEDVIFENIETEKDNLYLSTIHKAKGKEFENVYLSYDIEEHMKDTKENAKVLYVAYTRAKKGVNKLNFDFKDSYSRLKGSNRFYKYTYSKGVKKISEIEIGIEGDIDYFSFINEEIVGDCIENIEYISRIKRGDGIILIKENNEYYIYHNEKRIGKMKSNFFSDWKNTNRFENVKVKNVITIINDINHIPSFCAEPFKNTGVWLGIELEGFGKRMK